MSYTKAKIYNVALKNLGISTNIVSDLQTDKNTVVLNEYYDIAKEQVLKDFDWNFASSYIELTPTTTKSKNPKFEYEYDYPNDCACAREIVISDLTHIAEFEIATNTTGARVIHTNYSPAVLRYSKSSANQENLFTAEFVMALSWYLAFLGSSAITGARAKTGDCLTIYQKIIANAKKSNANEGIELFNTDCDWLN